MASDPHPDEQRVVAQYLQAGTPVLWYQGWSTCRICGQENGDAELTDGEFLWPEGLAHYVEAHEVRLPFAVLRLMLNRQPLAVDAVVMEAALSEGRITVDRDWWKAEPTAT